MCRVLVAHMIKTRILQHCKKIKHVGAKGTNMVFLFCTVADAAPLPMCNFALVSSV